MTTKNLQGIDALREAISASANGVRARAQEVIDNDDALKASIESEQSRALQDANDAAIVARLLQQQHADTIADLEKDRQVLSEEGAQLAGILAGAPAATAATNTSVEVDANAASEEISHAPREQVADDPAPTEAIPVKQYDVRDPREWGTLALWLAAGGIVLGLIIADIFQIDDWVRLHSDGFIGGIFTILWWVGWPALFSGWFGVLGARHEQKKARHA